MKNSLVTLLLVLASSAFGADSVTAPVSYDAGSSLTIHTGVRVTGQAGSIWDFTDANIIGLTWAGVDKTGAKLSDIAGTATVRGISKEIWVSLRTDAKPGAGTAEDPFDGSTALKFDAIMRGLVANEVVHLLPGTYLTTGSKSYNETQGYYLPAGVVISGAGMYSTTVKASAYPATAFGNGHSVWEQDSTKDNAGTDISQLTIDCNWQNLAAGAGTKTNSLSLHGNNISVRWVREINGYGYLASNYEPFGISIGTYTTSGVYQDVVGALIENCVNESFRGDYGVAMTLFSESVSTASVSGTIRGCSVRSWHGTCAFQAFGHDINILNNTVTDSEFALHIDTGAFDNVTIRGNHFTGITTRAIDVVPTLGSAPSCKNLLVEGNFIEMVLNSSNSFVGINVTGTSGYVTTNARVSRNTIIVSGSGGLGGNGIATAYVDGALIDGNLVVDAPANTISGVSTNVTIRGNYDNTGANPLGLSDTIPPVSAVNYEQAGTDANTTWSNSKRVLRTAALTATRTITLPNTAAFNTGDIITFIDRSTTNSSGKVIFRAADGESIDGNTVGSGYTTDPRGGNNLTIHFEAAPNNGPGASPLWIRLPEPQRVQVPTGPSDTGGTGYDWALDDTNVYFHTPSGTWKKIALTAIP